MNRCRNCYIECEGDLCLAFTVRRVCHHCHRRLESNCFDNERVDICSVRLFFLSQIIDRNSVVDITRNVVGRCL